MVDPVGSGVLDGLCGLRVSDLGGVESDVIGESDGDRLDCFCCDPYVRMEQKTLRPGCEPPRGRSGED